MTTLARCLASVAMLALLLTAVPACKKARDAAVENAVERATGAQVEVEDGGGSMTIKTDEGDLSITSAQDGGNVALPADFPKDIFLPAEHRVASVMDMAGLKMVNLTTPAAIPALSADVEKTMQAGGWKREMAMQADGSATLMFSKDKRQVVYQFVKDDAGGTQLAIRASMDG